MTAPLALRGRAATSTPRVMQPKSASDVRRASPPYSPLDLAAWLETWALRREKVLELIDIEGARRARHLAQRSRSLGAGDRADDAWRRSWTSLKLEVAAFLSESRTSTTRRAVRRG